MHVAVLALDDVFDAGLALVLDGLEVARGLAPDAEVDWSTSLVGVRRRVRTHQGFLAPVAAPGSRPDVVIVPAIDAKTPETLGPALLRPDVRDAGALLRTWLAEGTRVAAACTSSFVVAHAGLLDGKRATTTWWLAPYFRQCFPAVQLDEEQMIASAGKVVTAGAALAHLDLVLWLIRRRSPTLARAVAQHLLHDDRPSQAPYMTPEHLQYADPIVERFEQYARRHLADFSMGDAARAVGASERTLERRVRAVLGKSPVSFVQDVRVAQAIHRMNTTDETIDEIAARVGYKDGPTLRTLLRKKTGRTVRELRKRG